MINPSTPKSSHHAHDTSDYANFGEAHHTDRQMGTPRLTTLFTPRSRGGTTHNTLASAMDLQSRQPSSNSSPGAARAGGISSGSGSYGAKVAGNLYARASTPRNSSPVVGHRQSGTASVPPRLGSPVTRRPARVVGGVPVAPQQQSVQTARGAASRASVPSLDALLAARQSLQDGYDNQWVASGQHGRAPPVSSRQSESAMGAARQSSGESPYVSTASSPSAASGTGSYTYGVQSGSGEPANYRGAPTTPRRYITPVRAAAGTPTGTRAGASTPTGTSVSSYQRASTPTRPTLNSARAAAQQPQTASQRLRPAPLGNLPSGSGTSSNGTPISATAHNVRLSNTPTGMQSPHSPLAQPPRWATNDNNGGTNSPAVLGVGSYPQTPTRTTSGFSAHGTPTGAEKAVGATSFPSAHESPAPSARATTPHQRTHESASPAAPSPAGNGLGVAKQQLKSFCNAWVSKSSENQGAFGEGGYCSVKPGQVLNGRYEVACKLGWGEFSTVWLVVDQQATAPHRTFCALKIAKCRPDVTRNTKYECYLMNYLRETVNSQAKAAGAVATVSSRKSPLVTLLDVFEHRGAYGGHLCMAMPLHGSNLLCIVDQVKAKRRRRTEQETQLIKHVSRATLLGLDTMAKSKTLHTDIKPENVLCGVPDPKVRALVVQSAATLEQRNASKGNPSQNSAAMLAHFDSTADDDVPIVRLADFGLSLLLEPSSNPQALSTAAQKVVNRKELNVVTPGVLSNTQSGMLIQTREYRAPEVLLGTDFNCRTDVWSVGAMVYELITGNFLFDPKRKTRNEREMDIEHLAMIMQVLGPVPAKLARPGAGKYTHRYFDESGRFLYAEKYRNYPRRNLAQELESCLEPREAEEAARFILACFSYDPNERCHAGEVARHTWLRNAQV